MRRFFVDAFYWIALLNPRDQWHARVLAFAATLDAYRFYTTGEVLIELLAFYRTANPTGRTCAVAFVRALLDDEDMPSIPQTRAGFLYALDLYATRPNKQYSLTDCHSMQVMRREGLADVLTHDHHFTEEGLHIVFR
jgi:predicted nucleic acid-binding protein